jgi:hypothetical protein
MKKLMIVIIAIAGLAIASCNPKFRSIRNQEKRDSTSVADRYRLHEIIVMYKKEPTAAEVDTQKAALAARGIEAVTVRKCLDCKGYVELWEADSIHTMIHADGISPGTVSKDNKTVGEDKVAHYSVNFLTSIPMDSALGCCPNLPYNGKVPQFSGEGKDTIRVAVLDTGIDAASVGGPGLQWKNAEETTNETDDDGNCYIDDTHGWNFIDNNSDVDDDNDNMHGTLVSHYIINEFALSPKNFVQIMSLKTHNASGQGDLFSIICALHYAMDKGANIINASWGFYYHNKGTHPYLDNLITETMRQKGILFVTAAGNTDKVMDDFARNAYRERYGVEIPYKLLRNLEYHRFYPACLSREGRNVVTVTTTDGTLVSPRQNFSEQYVDIGVMGDVNDANAMQFKTPSEPIGLISGSSFATAIACGKIGAYFPKSRYLSSLNKDDVFDQLKNAPVVGTPPLITFETVMKKRLIRDGKMTYPK